MFGSALEPRPAKAILSLRRIVMANLLGALIGAAIDREDGDSGIKGAIIGTVAESAIRALAPVVATYALGWAVQYGIRKGWHALIGEDPLDQNGRLKPRAT